MIFYFILIFYKECYEKKKLFHFMLLMLLIRFCIIIFLSFKILYIKISDFFCYSDRRNTLQSVFLISTMNFNGRKHSVYISTLNFVHAQTQKNHQNIRNSDNITGNTYCAFKTCIHILFSCNL